MPTSQGSVYRTRLPKALSDTLKELSRQQEVTLYMTLVAAFQTLLYRSTGQDDLVIGSKLQLVSAQTIFKGIVSYSAAHTSSTFVGLGVFPEDDWALLHWNPYKLTSPLDLPANKALYGSAPELSSDDPEGATIGIGLAQVLQVSFDAKTLPKQVSLSKPISLSSPSDPDLAALSQEVTQEAAAQSLRPAIELLCAPPGGGMPNAMTMSVRKIFNRPTKELDNQSVKLDIQRGN